MNWVDDFTTIAGLPPATAYLENGGTNFAVGGSTSALLAAQIAVYLVTVKGSADPTDLFVIWIGSNDFLAGLQPSDTSAAISAEIAVLSLAGAQQFLVINVPDISLTPNIIAEGTAKVQAAKQFVAIVDSQLQSHPVFGVSIGSKNRLNRCECFFYGVGQQPGRLWFQK